MQLRLTHNLTKVLHGPTRLRRRCFIGIIGLFFLGSHATGAQTDLSDLVREGLSRSFAIQTQRHQHLTTNAATTSAWMSLLPSLSIAGGRTSQVSESLDAGSKSKIGSTANTLSASATWNLWDNYANFRNIESKTLQSSVSLLESEQLLQSQVVQIVTLYLNYLVLLEREEILKEQMAQAQWAQDQAELLVNIGARTRLDVLEAEIEVKSTQLSLFEAQRALPNALKQLQFLVNSEQSHLFTPQPIQKLKPYFEKAFQKSLPTIRSQVGTQFEAVSPDLQIARMQVELSRADYLQSRLSYLPSTSLTFGFSRDLNGYVKDTPAVGERDHFDSWSVTLGLSWTIWDWLNTHRSIEAQKRSLAITKIGYQEKLFSKSNEIQGLLDQYDANEKSVEASELLLQKAKEQQEYSGELYKLGKRTMIEVQKANTSYSRAQLDLNERLKTRFVTMAQIMLLWNQSLRPPGFALKWSTETSASE